MRGPRLQVFGRPFNRALMHYGPLFYWQSALISTRVRELGCRFYSTLEVCEDRDFLAQIADHGDFVFVPAATTFNYRPDLGTSATGDGANRNVARVARFENLLRAKQAGSGIYHNERAATHVPDRRSRGTPRRSRRVARGLRKRARRVPG